MTTPAKLEFFKADTLNPITLGDFGTEYRNTSNNIIPIVIANTGGRDAINVKAKFISAIRNDGREDSVSKNWKSLAYDSDAIYKAELDLPDIPPGKFMAGYKVYSETFDNIIGKFLSQDWDTKGGSWEVYFLTENNKQNSYLHHLVENTNITTGKTTPMHFPKAKNCELSVDIAVQKYNFGGVQLRVDENGQGYYIIVYPDPVSIERVNNYYSGIIPNYIPIDPNFEAIVGIGKGNYTDLDVMDNFNIFNRCTWLPIGTGTIGLQRDNLTVKLNENVFDVYFNGEHLGRHIDNDNPIITEGRMALLAGRRYGSVVIFDNIEYRTQTERGILYVKSAVPANPDASLDGDNIYNSTLVIEYSD